MGEKTRLFHCILGQLADLSAWKTTNRSRSKATIEPAYRF